MLRDNLDKYSNATCTRAIQAIPKELDSERIAQIARISVARPIKTVVLASDAIVSNWWLLHFANRESEQVAVWPPSTHAEVSALNPEAVAAEPIPSPIDDMADVEVMTND